MLFGAAAAAAAAAASSAASGHLIGLESKQKRLQQKEKKKIEASAKLIYETTCSPN